MTVHLLTARICNSTMDTLTVAGLYYITCVTKQCV